MRESTEDTQAATPDDIDATQAVPPDGIEATPAATVPAKRSSGKLGRGDVVGRYVVLSKLGAGGMGVVYAAYDPELDRKVAVKMLLTDPSGQTRATHGRERLLREAQALAKFSHPEIVAVHDVGEHEVGVWVAMEFVDGRTLGAWAREHARSWREALDVMLAAGRGVAAAHAAGLIHRDLKPDNIMVGRDGRVRVMDFGLTRSQSQVEPKIDDDAAASRQDQRADALTRHGSLVGTPAYMAPEQFSGADVSDAADQFSYCVTLWELLFAERPFAGTSVAQIAASVLEGRLRTPSERRRVPAWLRRICERGLARSPTARWPSMQVLLAELERGHARARRRVGAALLGGVVVVGLLAFGYQNHATQQAELACEAEGASIDEIWNDDARARVRAGLLATKAGYAGTTVEKLLPYLDAQAQSWREHEITACRNANVEDTWDADTLDRASWCLDERRGELASLIAEFEHADAVVLPKAISAAAGLTKISPCLDVDTLMKLPAPPRGDARQAVSEVRDELVTAQTLHAAGKYREGLVAVTAARKRAEALDWPPLSARARQLEALLLEKSGESDAAEDVGVMAYMQAARSGAWDVAADAATRLAWNIGVGQARDEDARLWADHAEIAISFAGDVLGLREASRLNALAVTLEIAGEFKEAIVMNERALVLLEQALGPDHPDLAPSFNNLGNIYLMTTKFEKAKPQYERALALRERALGPEHPDVALSLNGLANIYAQTGELEAARAMFERTRTIFEQAFGPEHPNVAATLNNLAYIAKASGEFEQAELQYERMLVILDHALPPEHPDIAVGLTNLALVEVELAHPEQALPHLERAVAIYDALEGVQNNELPARFAIAKLLVATDRPRALAEAAAAHDGYHKAGEPKRKHLAEVDAWLAEQAQE